MLRLLYFDLYIHTFLSFASAGLFWGNFVKVSILWLRLFIFINFRGESVLFHKVIDDMVFDFSICGNKVKDRFPLHIFHFIRIFWLYLSHCHSNIPLRMIIFEMCHKLLDAHCILVFWHELVDYLNVRQVNKVSRINLSTFAEFLEDLHCLCLVLFLNGIEALPNHVLRFVIYRIVHVLLINQIYTLLCI